MKKHAISVRALTGLSAAFLLFSACASSPTLSQVRTFGQRGQTEQLFEAWSRAQTDTLRIAIIEGFAENSSDVAGARLVVRQAGAARSKRVQLAALRALRVYEGDEVDEALIRALGHPWPEIGEVAHSVLAAKGERTHAALLQAAQGDPEPQVRVGAAKLLVRAASVNASFRSTVQELLLRTTLKDRDARLREVAARGLGRLRFEAARPELAELARSDADATVRLQAAEALRALGQRPSEARIVVAVLPLEDQTGENDPETVRLGRQVADYVAARLSASKVCEVVDREKVDAALEELRKVGKLVFAGDAANAPELGNFKLANQLVYGTVQRQGATYTIVLNRMSVTTLELVAGASVTVSGRRADLGQLQKEAAERLIRRFR